MLGVGGKVGVRLVPRSQLASNRFTKDGEKLINVNLALIINPFFFATVVIALLLFSRGYPALFSFKRAGYPAKCAG